MKKESTTKKESEVKSRQKREIPHGQKVLNELMRATRKAGFKFIKSIKDSESEDAALTKLTDAFDCLIKKITNLQSEMMFLSRFSMMSAEEKEMLKKMLND